MILLNRVTENEIYISLAGRSINKTELEVCIVGVHMVTGSEGRISLTWRSAAEYDNIIRSLYFLNYIDSPPLRRNVQKALNRGESYHKLRKAVSYANFGKLRFKNENDQHIWGECSRLLANCIIYYNASILSNMLAYRERNGQDSDMLKQISPVAWQLITQLYSYLLLTATV